MLHLNEFYRPNLILVLVYVWIFMMTLWFKWLDCSNGTYFILAHAQKSFFFIPKNVSYCSKYSGHKLLALNNTVAVHKKRLPEFLLKQIPTNPKQK